MERANVKLISKDEMEKRIEGLKSTTPLSISHYISKGGAKAYKRTYKLNSTDLLLLYTYVFSYGTYRVIINGNEGVTDCYDYAN